MRITLLSFFSALTFLLPFSINAAPKDPAFDKTQITGIRRDAMQIGIAAAARPAATVRIETRVEVLKPADAPPQALARFSDGTALLVSPAASQDPQAVAYDVTGIARSLPLILIDQMRLDAPDALSRLTPETAVTVRLEVRPDQRLRVTSVTPAATDAATALSSTASSDGSRVSTALSTPSVSSVNRGPRPLSKGTTSAMGSPSIVNETAGLLSFLGVSPSAVSQREVGVTRSSVDATVVELTNGRTIAVWDTGRRTGNQFVWRVEAKVEDLSSELRSLITDRLKANGNGTILAAENVVRLDVVFTAKGEHGEKFVVLTVALMSGVNRDTPPMILWSDHPGSWGSAVASVAHEALGLSPGGYRIADHGVNGAEDQVRVVTLASPPREITLDWRAESDGGTDFSSMGKASDFSAEMRDSIRAALQKMAADGDVWAADALAGDKAVVVTFGVNENETSDVRVKDVSPLPQDAAAALARNLGLGDTDFFTMTVSGEPLLVLQRGVTVSVPSSTTASLPSSTTASLPSTAEGTLRLVAPDGDIKFFVRAGKARKDRAIVMMMSRVSLKANRDAFAPLCGKTASPAIQHLLDQFSKTDQFIIRLDPSSEDAVTVRAMTGTLEEGTSLILSRAASIGAAVNSEK